MHDSIFVLHFTSFFNVESESSLFCYMNLHLHWHWCCDSAKLNFASLHGDNWFLMECNNNIHQSNCIEMRWCVAVLLCRNGRFLTKKVHMKLKWQDRGIVAHKVLWSIQEQRFRFSMEKVWAIRDVLFLDSKYLFGNVYEVQEPISICFLPLHTIEPIITLYYGS